MILEDPGHGHRKTPPHVHITFQLSPFFLRLAIFSPFCVFLVIFDSATTSLASCRLLAQVSRFASSRRLSFPYGDIIFSFRARHSFIQLQPSLHSAENMRLFHPRTRRSRWKSGLVAVVVGLICLSGRVSAQEQSISMIEITVTVPGPSLGPTTERRTVTRKELTTSTRVRTSDPRRWTLKLGFH